MTSTLLRNGRFPPTTAALIPAALTFTLYLLTMPPDLTLAHFGTDGGELITAAVTLGVAHPPGYPTYVLLGKAASLLPIGTVAYRFHLLSAVAASLTVATLFDLLRRTWSTQTALTTALILATSSLFWSQAIIAEVYPLALLGIALTLWSHHTDKPAWLTGLLLGTAVTCHLTALFLLPLLLLDGKRPSPIPFLTGLTAGLTPFLLLPLLANGSSPVVWGDPTTLRGWWWLVSAQLYRANVLSLPPADWLPRLQSWAIPLLTQFTWGGIPLIIWSLIRRPNRRHLLLTATAALYLLYAFTYATPDALVFTLPAWLLLSVLLAPAVHRVGKWAAILPAALLLLNFSQLSLHNEPGPMPTAAALLQSAPPQAVIETPGDESIFVFWYAQHVRGIRPDLALIDANLAPYPWYQARLPLILPNLKVSAGTATQAQQAAAQTQRPFCTATIHQPTITCPGASKP